MENTKLIRSATLIDRILKILQGFAIAGVAVAAIFIWTKKGSIKVK